MRPFFFEFRETRSDRSCGAVAAAGKTTLVERYLNKRFVENPQATIGAAFNAKKISINGQSVVIGLWDTAGSERYEAMSRIYYRSAKAAILCFDLRDNDSFEKLKEWVAELKEHEPTCALYIVGCKLDTVVDGARVDATAIRNFAEKVGAQVFETSSKTGRNVDELFFSVAENWLRAHGPAVPDAGAAGGANPPVNLNANGGAASTCPC